MKTLSIPRFSNISIGSNKMEIRGNDNETDEIFSSPNTIFDFDYFDSTNNHHFYFNEGEYLERKNISKQSFMAHITRKIHKKENTYPYYHNILRYMTNNISINDWIFLLRNDFENAWCALQSYDWKDLYNNDGWFHLFRESVLINKSKFEHVPRPKNPFMQNKSIDISQSRINKYQYNAIRKIVFQSKL